MTLTPEIEAEIRRLFFTEHWKVGTIAAQLGRHPDQVRRLCGLTSAKRVLPSQQPSPLLPYLDFVRETLAQYPKLRATRLDQMLRARGYTGSVRTIRKYVRGMRPARRPEVFVRTEVLPGEQAQIDWMHVGTVPVPGGERALWAFVMVLGHSRGMWAELVFDLDVHSLRRSLVRACAALGGSARQWLFDNPKTVVLGRQGDVVRFHPALLEVAGAYHALPRVCGVRKPQHKGKVERAVRYLRESFFAARPLRDRDTLNAQLWTWIDEVAHRRPHPVQRGRTVAEVLAEERARLLPIPAAPPSLERVEPVRVDSTATVRFDGNSYSVPPEHAGQTRTLAADDREVRVLEGANVIAVHARCWGRAQQVEDPAHRAAVLALKTGAREPKGRDRLLMQVPQIELLLKRWLLDGRHVGTMVKRAIQLLDAYGAEVVRAAVGEMVERGTYDSGALAVLCEQQRRATARPIPMMVSLGAHVPEREVLPHPLEGYDEQR